MIIKKTSEHIMMDRINTNLYFLFRSMTRTKDDIDILHNNYEFAQQQTVFDKAIKQFRNLRL